mgnify:CR=1 FL=1
MLELNKCEADLSRRCRVYTMQGLSFREYLILEGVADLPKLSIEDLLKNHATIASQITNKYPIRKYFEQYLPEYKNLDEMIKQNASYKQAMFMADQQLKQLRRKAVIVINDERYKLRNQYYSI